MYHGIGAFIYRSKPLYHFHPPRDTALLFRDKERVVERDNFGIPINSYYRIALIWIIVKSIVAAGSFRLNTIILG